MTNIFLKVKSWWPNIKDIVSLFRHTHVINLRLHNLKIWLRLLRGWIIQVYLYIGLGSHDQRTTIQFIYGWDIQVQNNSTEGLLDTPRVDTPRRSLSADRLIIFDVSWQTAMTTMTLSSVFSVVPYKVHVPCSCKKPCRLVERVYVAKNANSSKQNQVLGKHRVKSCIHASKRAI